MCPRQKIYEVLDSLIEKGIRPGHPGEDETLLCCRTVARDPELSRAPWRSGAAGTGGTGAVCRLACRRSDSRVLGRPRRPRNAGLSPDRQRAVTDRGPVPAHAFRGTVRVLGVLSSPYAVDPLDEQLVKQARLRGVTCRLLYETGTMDDEHKQRMEEYKGIGVEVYSAPSLPMKLGRVRWPSGNDRAARSGNYEAIMDGAHVRSSRIRRGHARHVRRSLAAGCRSSIAHCASDRLNPLSYGRGARGSDGAPHKSPEMFRLTFAVLKHFK